jgi:hypothetical protein
VKPVFHCVCALALSACAAPGAPRVVAATPAPASAGNEDLVGIGLAAAAAELVAEGYRASRAPEQGFLAPSMRALSTLEVAPHSCVAVAAAATPSIADLDAALYAADGSVLAEDDSASPRPVLRLCSADQALSAHLALFAFQGAGSYALQRFEKPLSASDLAEAAAGEGAASARFLELLRSLQARGYQEEAPVVDVPLVPGAASRLALKVLAGHCYSVVADGAEALLRLLGSDGNELSRGVGAAGPAALQHCANRDGELSLELSSGAAARSLRVARLWAAQGEVGGARSLWLGEPMPAASEARPPIHAAAKQGGCGARVETLLHRHALAQGSLWESSLPAHGCVLLEATLHEGLARATLRVEDAQGVTLMEQELRAPQAAAYLCTKAEGARISLIARAGFGQVTLTRRACSE